MSSEEKRISFMNRYFVFKKVRNVDVSKIADVIKKQNVLQVEHEEQEIKELEKDVKKDEVEPPKKLKIKKTGKKITLKKFDTPPE